VILRLDHVGLITGDLPGAAGGLELLDLVQTYSGAVPGYGVATQFWAVAGDGPAVELVAPATDDAAVRGQLDRRGPGLHHVAYEVDDIDKDLAVLHERGAGPVADRPCQGGRPGLRVAFVHLGPSSNLLVELVDYGRS